MKESGLITLSTATESSSLKTDQCFPVSTLALLLVIELIIN